MSFNYETNIVIKEEPVSEPSFASQDGPKKESLEPHIRKPEFVNIKIEPTVEISIKQENIIDGSPPYPTSEASDDMWPVVKTEMHEHMPTSDKGCGTTFKENLTVKIERVDVEFQIADIENRPTEHTSLQPNTSNEYYKEIQSENVLTPHDSYQSTSCPICQKQFANVQNVKRHLLLHARIKYQCVKCSRQFLNEARLNNHLCKYDVARRHECKECGKKFKCSSKLKQHSRVHLTEKPYFCNICHRSFTTELYLVKHQGKSRCKRPIDEPLTCQVCFKDFDKEFLLKSHLRKHETDRPFSCDLCGMNFKYKSAVVRHIMWHNGTKPYACKFCNKTFVHSGLLKPHLRTHTGEKPYECSVCLKKFSHKHNMQRHALRHCKVKKLVCEICHKKFPRESRLIYHMRTHLNVKGFSCHVCNKKFSHRQNVLRHYSRKHPGEVYDCRDTDAKLAIKVWDTMKHIISSEPDEILS